MSRINARMQPGLLNEYLPGFEILSLVDRRFSGSTKNILKHSLYVRLILYGTMDMKCYLCLDVVYVQCYVSGLKLLYYILLKQLNFTDLFFIPYMYILSKRLPC
jgi:hypothetical protein